MVDLILELHGFPAGSGAEALPPNVVIAHTRGSQRKRYSTITGMVRAINGRYAMHH